jgi:hypothetical protein
LVNLFHPLDLGIKMSDDLSDSTGLASKGIVEYRETGQVTGGSCGVMINSWFSDVEPLIKLSL